MESIITSSNLYECGFELKIPKSADIKRLKTESQTMKTLYGNLELNYLLGWLNDHCFKASIQLPTVRYNPINKEIDYNSLMVSFLDNGNYGYIPTFNKYKTIFQILFKRCNNYKELAKIFLEKYPPKNETVELCTDVFNKIKDIDFIADDPVFIKKINMKLLSKICREVYLPNIACFKIALNVTHTLKTIDFFKSIITSFGVAWKSSNKNSELENIKRYIDFFKSKGYEITEDRIKQSVNDFRSTKLSVIPH